MRVLWYYLFWQYQELKHRLTCFRCYPGHLTGIHRRQGGRSRSIGITLAVSAIFAFAFLISWLLGNLLAK